MKAKPKSCGCGRCKYAKGTVNGRLRMKLEERAFRHGGNQALRQGSEDIVPAGCRSRMG